MVEQTNQQEQKHCDCDAVYLEECVCDYRKEQKGKVDLMKTQSGLMVGSENKSKPSPAIPHKPLVNEDIVCLGCKFATTYDLAKGMRIECNETKGLVLDADRAIQALQGLLAVDWITNGNYEACIVCKKVLIVMSKDWRCISCEQKHWLGSILEEEKR